MADSKISVLAAGSPVLATDLVPIARAGANFKLTFAQIFQGGGIDRISVGGADSGVSKRSTFSANSEQYALSVRYSSAGGPVYFGAKSASGTPDGVVSGAGGSAICTFENAGRVYLDQGQLGFPATQNPSSDPNTLDDCEKGTFTPTNGGSATYNFQRGLYTKTGRQVNCHFDFSINAIGTGNTGSISGLPFASNSVQNQSGHVSYWANLAIASYFVSVYVGPATTVLTLSGSSSAGVTISGAPYGVMTNSTALVGGITYAV